MPDSAIRRLLEFDRQVQRDSDQSPAFLHRRDRRFALDCHDSSLTPDPDLWLQHVRRLRVPVATDDPLRRWRHLTKGFALAGLITGVLAMLGLLFYDGGQRINLTVILAFVLLQCLLAAITTVQAFAGWQPWPWLLRKLFRGSPPGALYSLQPMLMARAAHTGGLMFGLAGLGTLLVLVVIQDLAFGWSTTLDTGPVAFHRLTDLRLSLDPIAFDLKRWLSLFDRLWPTGSDAALSYRQRLVSGTRLTAGELYMGA